MSNFEPNGFRTIDYTLSRPVINKLKKTWKISASQISPYPEKFHGKGIVMCAGGLKYFTCAWIAIQRLRASGCQLPVELWYLGNELSPEVIGEMEKYNVKCQNFLDYEHTTLKGCMLKPLSIIRSSFKEVLFLDADNICVRNPDYLFETEAYKEYGAVFWPDFWKTAADNPIWNIIGIPYTETYEQESGQLVIDKQRCWVPLNLSLHFNILNNIYYLLLMGDKDTFRFSWLAMDQPFVMIEHPVGICGYLSDGDFLGNTMVQHDTNGEILFLHRNLMKWDTTHKDEFCWETIKRFPTKAKIETPAIPAERQYIFGHSEKAYQYIDFQGDYEIISFTGRFGNLELQCLDILEELRNTSFYKKFLLYSHFARTRYRPENIFQLA